MLGVFNDSSYGQQRLFEITAEEVANEVPEYLSFVEAEILKHGPNHPFVKTQYFCEEIDAEGGMFPPARQALLKGAPPGTLHLGCHCEGFLNGVKDLPKQSPRLVYMPS
jgi:hypothetical protein